jgi:hypothetical protein
VATDAVAHTVWNTVKLRPVAKKGGDATLTGAYRGIGIQTALARLLAMLVLQRLAPAVERAGLLSRSQAGFRNREEAVAQAAALLEICGRRRAAGLNTYLLFIDFASAYDMVPHELLLGKLEAMGIRGPLLVYLTQSLKNHAARPAVGNTVGDSFRVRRGLVQGCPLSPLLFNLFIDDLFRDAAGVEVPAGQRGGGAALSIADLKYADDVVALASSRADLQTRLDTVAQWCLDNGMQLGAAKCGVMVVGKSERATRGRHARLLEASERWCIVDGAWRGPSPLVPVVERYTYLGVEINGSLDLKASARARAAKAAREASLLSQVHGHRRIPPAERGRGVVLGVGARDGQVACDVVVGGRVRDCAVPSSCGRGRVGVEPVRVSLAAGGGPHGRHHGRGAGR